MCIYKKEVPFRCESALEKRKKKKRRDRARRLGITTRTPASNILWLVHSRRTQRKKKKKKCVAVSRVKKKGGGCTRRDSTHTPTKGHGSLFSLLWMPFAVRPTQLLATRRRRRGAIRSLHSHWLSAPSTSGIFFFSFLFLTFPGEIKREQHNNTVLFL